ncbi:GGDEF domain-containing protein [Candidatus Venteria ishoeyi]|uniref:diguanylate cyclase n=1 Tax=Candidatus Venteria ishoeyi TaxID=1899563 RepID=A0A1H6F7P0_9GAMM|nr:GGDEF domain-containing protein [Candidatus Venteria ishoeyi]SEH06148.1 Response regulator PleD [Candidatus Venteria ishoeyi]
MANACKKPEFSIFEQQQLLQGSELRQVKMGEVLFTQGETGDCMYWLESGEIEILFKEGQSGKRLQSDAYFGELALLTGGSTRSATAVATRNSQLRVIQQQRLQEIQQSHPQMLCQLLQRTCAYLIEHENSLLADLSEQNRSLTQALDYLRRTRDELDASEIRANTDELTQLYNRRCFEQRMHYLFSAEYNKGKNPQLAVLIFDLDRFKAINDTHGHTAGDTVLKCLARLLRSCCRNNDFPCRLGGDEFIVLLPDTQQKEAFGMAELLYDAMRTLKIRIPTTTIQVTVSIGLTLYRAGDTTKMLMERTDQALHRAKQQGRDQIVEV